MQQNIYFELMIFYCSIIQEKVFQRTNNAANFHLLLPRCPLFMRKIVRTLQVAIHIIRIVFNTFLNLKLEN